LLADPPSNETIDVFYIKIYYKVTYCLFFYSERIQSIS